MVKEIAKELDVTHLLLLLLGAIPASIDSTVSSPI